MCKWTQLYVGIVGSSDIVHDIDIVGIAKYGHNGVI